MRRSALLLASAGLVFNAAAEFPPPPTATEYKSTCAPEACGGSYEELEVDVVILGAGMAGLTAAHTIESAGDLSYVLLEAKDRLGGRMDSFGGLPGATIEQHATWIGGHSPNPIYDLAVEFGIKLFQQDYNNEITYDLQGNQVTDEGGEEEAEAEGVEEEEYDDDAVYDDDDYSDEHEEEEEDYEIAVESINIAVEDEKSSILESGRVIDCVHEFAYEQLKEWNSTGLTPLTNVSLYDAMLVCGWNYQEEDSAQTWNTFDFAEGNPWESGLATMLTYYGRTDFQNEHGDYPEYFVSDPRGYRHIAERYAHTRLKQEPLLNTEVCKVDYASAEQGATVLTNKCQRYKARKVISTFSPHILRRRPHLFEPVVNVSGYGFNENPYVKIFFQFPHAFWPHDVEVMNIQRPIGQFGQCSWLGNLNHRRTSERMQQGEFLGSPDMWPGSNILLCFSRRETVTDAQGNLDKERAVRLIRKPLKRAFPNAVGGYVDPVSVHIPDWNKDPFDGGYETVDPSFTYEGFYEMIQPRANTLFLSGCFTCHRWSGWVHGAYYSGIRTANMVLESLGVEGVDWKSSTECDEWQFCKRDGQECKHRSQCCESSRCHKNVCVSKEWYQANVLAKKE